MVNGWKSFRFFLRLGHFHELPMHWASALTAALVSAWFFPGWAIFGGASHAGYARHHYFFPALGLVFVSVGCAFLRSHSVYRKLILQSKQRKYENFLIVAGYGLAACGVILAGTKGLGAAVFCAVIVLVATARISFVKNSILDAVMGALMVVLIYMTIFFKYRLPSLEYLGSEEFSQVKVFWYYLCSVFFFQFACLVLPCSNGILKWVALLFAIQPAWIVPLLVSLQWRWDPMFLFPIAVFLSWFGRMVWCLQKDGASPEMLLQIGRPLVDFLVLGSVGFALFFQWEGKVTVFNSYSMRTFLLWCPGCFIAAWILVRLQWRSWKL